MEDRFEALLHDLGKTLNLPLHPDRNRICQLNINDVLTVQIEDDPRYERVLIVTSLGEIPPGKFRENFLKEALKANEVYFPRMTLGYSERKNQLTLFAYLYLTYLTGAKAAEFLSSFVDIANTWRTGLAAGTVPSIKTKTQ